MWMGISSVGSSVIRKIAFLLFKEEQLLMGKQCAFFSADPDLHPPCRAGLNKVRQISLVIDKYFMRKLNSELWQLLTAFGKCKVIPQHHFKCLHS